MIKVKNSCFLIFGLSLFLMFFIHQYFLAKSEVFNNQSKLIESYLINGLLVFAFFLSIKNFLQKIKNNLGFIFIAVSLLKFVLFFIFINPTYKKDTVITTLEFVSFFTPYFTCLLVEVLFLSKLLNNLKFK